MSVTIEWLIHNEKEVRAKGGDLGDYIGFLLAAFLLVPALLMLDLLLLLMRVIGAVFKHDD